MRAKVMIKENVEDNEFQAQASASASASASQKDLYGLGLSISPGTITTPRRNHSRTSSATSGITRLSTISEPTQESTEISDGVTGTTYSFYPPYGFPASRFCPRNQQRLATAKSAILIYCALLGLSPILKSLTKSTASDSIWAISFWLMCINVIFFDYGGGVGATFPASLSTNAALMASTVLASRLPSTTHVFSLTLFSIEVFGLFPVFRRYLRHISWRGHLCLTWFLAMGAGAGVTLSLSGGGWKFAILGVVLGCLLTGLAMGICSWWLIGLQRYKNSIHGPWGKYNLYEVGHVADRRLRPCKTDYSKSHLKHTMGYALPNHHTSNLKLVASKLSPRDCCGDLGLTSYDPKVPVTMPRLQMRQLKIRASEAADYLT